MGKESMLDLYPREEWGLPPVVTSSPVWRMVLIVGGSLAAVIIVGWVVGSIAERWQEYRLAEIPARIYFADSPEEVRDLLVRAEELAQSGRPVARLGLAQACMTAADRLPWRAGLYGYCRDLLENLALTTGGDPWIEFNVNMVYSGVMNELGGEEQALAALNAASSALSRLPDSQRKVRSELLHLANNRVYLLVSASNKKVRDPGQALETIKLVISSRDELAPGHWPSGSAAFVDTLAMAWYASGDDNRAKKTQMAALGLANPGDHSVYLKHYDLFSSAADAPPR